jgi:hypothetical protein
MRLAGHALLITLSAGALACRSEVQPPTLPSPLPASEVTRKAPKPQPIDPKRDAKHKRANPRVSGTANSVK